MEKERAEAKMLAYQNAGAFIENHVEKSDMRQDDYSVDFNLYCEEKNKLAQRLYNKAKKIRTKYKLD